MTNTTIERDANTMTSEQRERLIFDNCMNGNIEDMAARVEHVMDTMSDATALQFYGQVCGLDAMAWAANDGSDKQIDKICLLDLLIDAVAPDLIARGYAPHMQSR
jgi:hypothetical protein